jgi:hypothetical protein
VLITVRNSSKKTSISVIDFGSAVKAKYLTKENAKILQVLPSSIDVNRSRLRKKLGLNETENLRDYLSRF